MFLRSLASSMKPGKRADLVLLAVERGLEVFERALDRDGVNLALRVAAQLVQITRAWLVA